jgi:exopolysaccharide biosynthesis protein
MNSKTKTQKILLTVISCIILTNTVVKYYSYKHRSKSQVEETTRQVEDITMLQNNRKDIRIAVFKRPLEFVFTHKNPLQLKDQAQNKYDIAINGSYFKGSYREAKHAGLMQVKGQKLENTIEDKQLTHIMVYDHDSMGMEFFPVKELNGGKYQSEKYTVIQTGPLIIQNNNVTTDSIQDSINGKYKHYRTLIGTTSTGETFFIVTTEKYTLRELAQELLNIDYFKDMRISTINLDGGPSTAIYVESDKQYNFNEEKELPLVIGVPKK